MSGNVPSKVKELIFTHAWTVHISESSFENTNILCVYRAHKNAWKCKWKWKGVTHFSVEVFQKTERLKDDAFSKHFTLENVFISVVCDLVGW